MATIDSTFNRNIYVICQSIPTDQMFFQESITFAYDIPLLNQAVNKLGVIGVDLVYESIWNTSADFVLYIQYEVPQEGTNDITDAINKLSYSSISSLQLSQVLPLLLDELDSPVRLFQLKIETLRDIVTPLNQSSFVSTAVSYSNTLINDQFLIENQLQLNSYTVPNDSLVSIPSSVQLIYNPNAPLIPPATILAPPVLSATAYRANPTSLIVVADVVTTYPYILMVAQVATDALFTNIVNTYNFSLITIDPLQDSVLLNLTGLEPETTYYVRCKVALSDGTLLSVNSPALAYDTTALPP